MSGRLVVPDGLRNLADQMGRSPWYSGEFDAQRPDALPPTVDAVANLNASARTLVEYQKLAEAENQRMIERFRNAADAYQEVDTRYGRVIGLDARQAAIDAIPLPAPSTPLPPIPDDPAPPQALDASGYSDVEQTHALLDDGDKGTSLLSVKENAEVAGGLVQTHAWAQTPTDWEGDAAQAAFTRLNSFTEWLGELAGAWKRLGEAAEKIKVAHDVAYTQHMMIWMDYLQLKNQLTVLMSTPHGVGNSVQVQAEMAQIYAKMADLQRESDEVRQTYAHAARFDPVRVARPPFGSGGDANAPTGAGGAGGGGIGGGGAPASMSQVRKTSPTSAEPAGGGAPSSGGSGSGGGSPSGSGSPSGGGSPNGSPSGKPGGKPTGTPTLPDGPSLHPAAAAAGGAGGGSGGGAGGGMGATPLQPSVAGKSIGPGAAGGSAGTGTAPAGAGSFGGAMGGGMGGMPMGGHGQNQTGKEKRRTPGLSPDEELYVEDREHTEEVIGARKRRTLQDPKDPQ